MESASGGLFLSSEAFSASAENAFRAAERVDFRGVDFRGLFDIAFSAFVEKVCNNERFPEAYGVFMAPYISPQAAEICAKEGIGYLDLAGNCRLSFGQVFIRREGIRNPFARKRDLRSLYAPKSTRILRVLLMRKSAWKTQALADEAGVSLGQVANVKKLPRDREWVADGEEGFKLTNPRSLLADWAENCTVGVGQPSRRIPR